MKFTPFDDRVVVLPEVVQKMTKGGLHLPDESTPKPTKGTVVAIGPGRLLPSGERSPIPLAIGDTVMFGRYVGTEIELGETFKIIQETEILGKFNS